MRIGLPFFAVIGASILFSAFASADIQHTIGKGHTLQAIANRYHVTVKAIMEANHITDPKHLKIGDVLTIPKADAPKDPKKDAVAAAGAKVDESASKAKTALTAKAEAVSASSAMKDKDVAKQGNEKAKTPGVIHIRRLGTSEEADLRIADHGNKVSASTEKSMEKMLRFPTGASHPIDARLIALLGVVSNHFGSRKIEVISGFRPYTPTQYTPHSNHNHGKAVDFHVIGVPNEQVRDFCKTLKNTGCGYYPNSTFVHMDVRDSSAFWIDYSKPGEPPRYNTPNVDADEGTSDVHGDGKTAGGNTPPPAEAPKPTTEESPAMTTPESDPPPATKPNDD